MNQCQAPRVVRLKLKQPEGSFHDLCIDITTAHKVAKAVGLLEAVTDLPCMSRNLAAVLHPCIDADLQLSEAEAVLDGVHINVYSECIYEEARVGALLSLA